MAEKRKDPKGRLLRSGEYYDKTNGRYMFRKMIDGQRYTITADDLSELRRQENEILCKIDMGAKIDSKNSKMTLNEYFDFWLETYAKSGRKITTIETYKANYKTYVRDGLGKKRIIKITKADCQRLVNQMGENGLSRSTANTLKSCLNKVFETAVDDDVIMKNPIRNVDLPKTPKKKRGAVELEHVTRFLEYVKNSPQYCYTYITFLTLFNTGVRIGELCAITKEDLDFKQDKIIINKQVNRYSKKTFGFSQGVASTKREASDREVPMNSMLKRELLQHIMKLSFQTTSLPYIDDFGVQRGTVTGFVFLNARGGAWDEDSFYGMMKRILNTYNKEAAEKKLEPIEDFCPHMARHTYTSVAYEKGADIKTVSEMLGHASVEITLDTYTHITQNKAQEQLEVAQAIKIS